MSRPRTMLVLPLIALATLACMETGGGAEDSPAGDTTPDVSALAGREIFEPQLAVEGDGTLLMVWREKGEAGFDLFVSHRNGTGAFSEPVRINDEPGTVYSYPHDQMRPGVAVGPDGHLGVAWSDDRAQIRAAVGRDHGAAWDPSVRLDQTETPAYRSFTAAAMDSRGAFHTVWIDARFAPQAGAEEPADLFYARVLGDEVTEINLTAEQEPSICGCCRPDLELAGDGRVRAIFRNTTADGFRDIFTVEGSVEAGFSAAQRIGPPAWELKGCPMSGPLGLGDQVMWRDASSGKWVLKLGTPSDEETTPVFADETDGWKLNGSPRQVVGTEGVVLVPGSPHSRVIARLGDDWALRHDDLPVWATSAAAIGDGLLVVGAVDGKLELKSIPAG